MTAIATKERSILTADLSPYSVACDRIKLSLTKRSQRFPRFQWTIARVNAALDLAVREANKSPDLLADVLISLIYVGNTEWRVAEPYLLRSNCQAAAIPLEKFGHSCQAVFSRETRIPGLHVRSELLTISPTQPPFIRRALVGINRFTDQIV